MFLKNILFSTPCRTKQKHNKTKYTSTLFSVINLNATPSFSYFHHTNTIIITIVCAHSYL